MEHAESRQGVEKDPRWLEHLIRISREITTTTELEKLLRDITTNPDDAAVAEAIIAMAHSLKLQVIAEGVEQRGQMDFLNARWCDEMQGFLFSRPVSEDAFTEILRAGLANGTTSFTAAESTDEGGCQQGRGGGEA